MTPALRSAVTAAFETPRARIAEWLGQLQPRERGLVGAAAAVSGLLLLWLGVVEPIGDAISRLDRGLVVARRDAGAIDDLVTRHRALSAEVARLERTSSAGDTPSSSVFARLEAIAVPIAGREHIGAMNPSTRQVGDRLTEESVEMRLDGVPLRSLVNLLYSIEHREQGLQLVRLSFKRQFKSPELVDATLVVARLRPS